MQNVLLTGGSGSLGQALTRKLLSLPNAPDRIVIYSRGEHLQEQMAMEFKDERLRFFIGDVRDYDRLSMAMRGVDTVFHAAALKIVPTLEYNPIEAVKTNINGAENVIKSAIRSGSVHKVMAVSTDKAVNPVNLYGATKLVAEKMFIAAGNLAGNSGPSFSCARYGNVVASRGSVIPLFKRLAAEGRSLPVTDERMTRFWITLDQAVEFVLAATNMAHGREIFIPKIPSVKVTDIATAINNNSPPPTLVGIRPGEKLHEVLMSDMESLYAEEHHTFYVVKPHGPPTTYKEFVYSSGGNTEWLTVEQIREAIA